MDDTAEEVGSLELSPLELRFLANGLEFMVKNAMSYRHADPCQTRRELYVITGLMQKLADLMALFGDEEGADDGDED